MGIQERLNPGGSGGSSGPTSSGPSDGIQVDTEVLERASRSAGDIHQRLGKDGRHAENATTEAAGSLKQEGFKLGRALNRTNDTWNFQVDTLLKACRTLEEALADTARGHRFVDEENAQAIAEISKHFD